MSYENRQMYLIALSAPSRWSDNCFFTLFIKNELIKRDKYLLSTGGGTKNKSSLDTRSEINLIVIKCYLYT